MSKLFSDKACSGRYQVACGQSFTEICLTYEILSCGLLRNKDVQFLEICYQLFS